MSPPLTDRDLVAYIFEMRTLEARAHGIDDPLDCVTMVYAAIQGHEKRMGKLPEHALCSTAELRWLITDLQCRYPEPPKRFDGEPGPSENRYTRMRDRLAVEGDAVYMGSLFGVSLWHVRAQAEPVVFAERAPLAEGMEGGE